MFSFFKGEFNPVKGCFAGCLTGCLSALLIVILGIAIIVNLFSLIFSTVLGFATAGDYAKYAMAAEKETLTELFTDVYSAGVYRDNLVSAFTPDYEMYEQQIRLEVADDPALADAEIVVTPIADTFFDGNYGEWCAGIVQQELDSRDLKRLCANEESGQTILPQDASRIFLKAYNQATERYQEFNAQVTEGTSEEYLVQYLVIDEETGQKIELNRYPTEGLDEEIISSYLERGYELETVETPAQVVLTMTAMTPDDIADNREYRYILDEESLNIAAEAVQTVDEGGSKEELRDKLVGSVHWQEATVEAGTQLGSVVGGPDGNGGNGGSVVVSSREEVMKSWPAGLSEERRQIASFAMDCVGKIQYVWGGHATGPGWDGIQNGLDCSHFIDWVFWTVVGDNLGNSSTAGLGNHISQITESQLLPGDLAFTKPPGSPSSQNNANHVLIFVGYNQHGERVFVDARSRQSGVCMSTYPSATLFYRPNCLAD